MVPITAVAHANVNCADLARSLRFYTALLGLRAAAHTAPERPQDCRAFGFEGDGQWDAWMLTAEGEPGGTAIDLLEWKLPRPVGRPPKELHHLGFARLGLEVPDAAVLRSRLMAAGAECADAAGEARFLARDPDGTLLELGERPGRPARLARVVVNCSDLRRSLDWYRRVLDLTSAGDARGASLVPRARPDGCVLELVEWTDPRPVGRPAAQPNHLGIFRMAFLVDDAHAAYAELRTLGVACPPPVWLEMGPEIPIDGLWAVFFLDPDGACLELIQSPRVLGS